MIRFGDTDRAREGILGFGERLNIILEIGGQPGIWERGS